MCNNKINCYVTKCLFNINMYRIVGRKGIWEGKDDSTSLFLLFVCVICEMSAGKNSS